MSSAARRKNLALGGNELRDDASTPHPLDKTQHNESGQYSHEHITCRTEAARKKNKPEDYWTTNYVRRKHNLDKGFYTSTTEPYRPIGGNLILDPYELVISALPGHVEKKFQPRMTRRGTVYEPNTPTSSVKNDEQGDVYSFEGSEDKKDTCPTAGFDNIKKLLQESRERIVCVRAGRGYEDHVRAVEEHAMAEEEALRPDDTGMVLHSASSIFMPTQNAVNQSNSPDIEDIIDIRSRGAKLDPESEGEKKKLKIYDTFLSPRRSISPQRRFSRPTSSLFSNRSPSPILKSPGSDRSETGSGKLTLIRCCSGYTKAFLRKERQLRDHFSFLKSMFNVLTAMHNMKLKDIRSKVPLCKELVEKLQREGAQRDDDRGSRGPYGSKYSKASRVSTVDIEDNNDLSGRMSVLGASKRIAAVDNAGKNYFGRRRSRNAASILANEKPGLETWEDLLNAQPPEFKDENNTFGFQVGIVTKFMKWYRRASIAPTHVSGGLPSIDRDTLSNMSQCLQGPGGEKEMGQGQYLSHAGSAQGQHERTKRLPIWQQVAQEKSSVFHNKKANATNPDSTIVRFKKEMNKLKRSVQKENTAELEKIVRERVASFRLKFGTLGEDSSPVFVEQMKRVQRANENVNRSQLENFDVQPSKWYEELKEKTMSMVASFEQPKIIDMIGKLQTYAHMDNKTLPLAKAKLCLLMMSLPAYDICQIYMQRALKFIFENILLGQEAQFDEWLNHRKLPYVVLDDTRPRSGNQYE